MSPDPQTFEAYRPLMFSIAYRMLGSAMEAEDMLQEAYLRYQAAADIRSPKAYLSQIITNLCLDQLKSARVQRENYFGPWLPEPILTAESPRAAASQHESISTAFLVILESLSPAERAVFLLREVFDYSYTEIAEMVGKSEANCRQIGRRARQYVRQQRPRFEPSSGEQERLVNGFLKAVESGDVAALTRLLTQDVAVYGDGGGKVPAAPHPLSGRERVVAFLMRVYPLLPADTRVEPAEVNGSPGLLFRSEGKLLGVVTFNFSGGQIQAIYNLLNPEKLAYIEQQQGGVQFE